MQTQDAQQIKAKILSTLRLKGPLLPVHIAKEIHQSILFASAFLAELTSEKKVKTSAMRVGTSPIYFLPEQFSRLEKFAEHLKSKEKEAYLLLKEKKFLVDTTQEPAIRVALRAIKDFAIPFEHDAKLIWRYITAPQEEYKKAPGKKAKQESMVPTATRLVLEKENEPKEKQLNIFDKSKKSSQKKVSNSRSKPKKSPNQKKQDKFFNTVKEYLNKKNIEIVDIISFSKSDLVLKVKNTQERILVAFNKKKIDEKDIIKAHKKASEHNLAYLIFALGDQTKKITELISAIQSLERLEKIG